MALLQDAQRAGITIVAPTLQQINAQADERLAVLTQWAREAGLMLHEDSREKQSHAWVYQAYGLPQMRSKLDTGDYSIIGFEDRIAVEVKRQDLYSSATEKRWNDWINRLAQIRYGLLLICHPSKSLLDTRRKGISPNAIVGRLASAMARGVSVVFLEDEHTAQRFALQYMLEAWARETGKK